MTAPIRVWLSETCLRIWSKGSVELVNDLYAEPPTVRRQEEDEAD